MAQNTSNVSIGIVANSTGLAAGLNDAKRKVDKFGNAVDSNGKRTQKSFNQVESSVIKVTSALKVMSIGAVAAMGATAVAMTKISMDSIDKVAKLSDQLGINTEALAALSHEADLAGISQDQFVVGLKKMQDGIANATNGSKSMEDAFARLGVNIKDIAGKSPEEQFYAIAEGFSQMESGAQKTALALDVFGRGGLGMISMLNLGSEGLRESAKHAE